ncbi:efflux RND transporter periplasmic adaptor subunit [Teredinibacter turnerae]|uniref:efflux RND transporter periplasmic adaptor subunit n=1 Tax=Teredinibacter turnerae TaxID=2426 RepID=UPI00036519FA|nr:efflux RND transporter periplasmic adaptor subunit [Teredinibacter turnerae]
MQLSGIHFQDHQVMTKALTLILAGALAGLLGGIAIAPKITNQDNATDLPAGSDTPLYWVAPMDPNYRRDSPGKSPMGMDLVPVYAEQDEPGLVSISPEVVNSLGVTTAVAERRELPADIYTYGELRYNEERLIHIHPRVAGWVDKLYIRAAGETVAANKPLYSLYSPQLVNAQEEYVLALRRKDSNLTRASEERLRALKVDERFIQQLKKSKEVRQTVTFYAPVDGVVNKLAIREGFYVQPGTTMMSIGQLNDIWLEAEIFAQQAALVETGQAVDITIDAFPNLSWTGEISYVYPEIDPQNRTLRARIELPNTRRLLKPGMYANLHIRGTTDTATLTVPNNAVIRTGHQNRVVLALGDGRYKSITVSLGRITDEFTEITHGLDDGDKVVTAAQFLLDSESSKSSDFKRMHQDNEPPRAVSVAATVESVMADMGMLKVTHDPIPDWDWPVMTMMFPVTADTDLSTLEQGQRIQIQIRQTGDTDWEITAISLVDHLHGVTP